MNSVLEQAKQEATHAGYVLTPRDIDNISALQEAEKLRLARVTTRRQPGRIERFNDSYPRLLEGMLGVGDVLLTLAQTLIIAFGIPAVLVLLLIVEQQRVVHGIQLFETEASLAAFAAWALVILNLVLEFQIHYVEHQAGYTQSRDTQFSLKIWWRNMRYTLGLGGDWKPRELSPAQRYRRILRLVTFSILALALAGSMKVVIAQTPGAWYEALGAIFRESDLLTMFVWLGGLLFAGAAVLAAQGLSRYVAIRCVEIVGQMNERQAQRHHQQSPELAAMDAVAADYIRARVAEKQAKQQAKAQKDIPIHPVEVKPEQPQTTPFGSYPLTPDAPVSMSMNGHANGNGGGKTGG